MDSFIRNEYEAHIKRFFMNDIDELLKNYEPGEPDKKPDVIKQIKEIDIQRSKDAQLQQQQMMQQYQQMMQQNPQMMQQYQQMMQQQQQQQQPQQIMMQAPGQPPVPLGLMDAVNIINSQQQKILEDAAKIKELEENLSKKSAEKPSKSVSFSENIALTKKQADNTIVLKDRIRELETKNRDLASKIRELELKHLKVLEKEDLETKNRELEIKLKQIQHFFTGIFDSKSEKNISPKTTEMVEQNSSKNITAKPTETIATYEKISSKIEPACKISE